MIFDRRPFRLAGLLVAAPLLFAAVPAHAQLSMGSGGGHAGAGAGKDDDEPKTPAAPPAIPGAVSSPDQVAPSHGNANDLDPDAALFDAIDRGDITAAREALGRGADLSARNVLGQTPIDMSIDLSRNDITFLLLSMRSQNGDQAPSGSPSGSDEEADADASTAAPPTGPVATLPSTVRPVQGGGTPVPSQGFLGFGK